MRVDLPALFLLCECNTICLTVNHTGEQAFLCMMDLNRTNSVCFLSLYSYRYEADQVRLHSLFPLMLECLQTALFVSSLCAGHEASGGRARHRDLQGIPHLPSHQPPGFVKETVHTKLFEIQVQKSSLLCLIDCILTLVVPSATMHGVGAEDGLHQRSAGAQSDPTWRHVPEGGDGGEPEELPEESSSPGGAGGVTEGETRITVTPENAQKSSVTECLILTLTVQRR